MGVPKFYRWISERYPTLSEVIREHQIPDFDNLYLDMNGVIHTCSHPNDDDVHFRITEEQIFQDIFRYLDFLFRMIKPQKVFFMAVDGVAPRAKMNQQRGRRFRSAKDAIEKEQEARSKGEVLPKEARFDSNCITPGTPFMARLQKQLEYFVSLKLSTDPLWRGVKVILSGHETPGEGEHKVMDFIRWQRSQPEYDPHTRHCLYGLDADLMMLGLASHEPYFCLLREEVKFIRKNKDGGQDSNKRAGGSGGGGFRGGNNNNSNKKARTGNPDETTFHLLQLSLLRAYLDHEFNRLKPNGVLPFKYNLENIIDDWILMGFLNGNDFIPHLPGFHINRNSFTVMYEAYISVLPTLDGYLNEDGKLHLGRFQRFIDCLNQFDCENFEELNADLKYLDGKSSGRLKPRSNRNKAREIVGEFPVSDDESDIPTASSLDFDKKKQAKNIYGQSSDGDDEESSDFSEGEQFRAEFRQHKDRYYIDKMQYGEIDNESKREEMLRDQAHGYIRALQWNLHYYYDGCVSWSWYYPHHYAPYVSDIKQFCDVNLNFDKGEPFKPFEQLLAVLPMASKDCLPGVFQKLVTLTNSPLKEFYPDHFDLDMNEKIHAWEAIVLIPFIDEKKLLAVAKEYEGGLTSEERSRNVHGPHLVYEWVPEDLGRYPSALPDHFPLIAHNHAKLAKWDKRTFCIPLNKIKKGLLPRVKLDRWMPGFATLNYVPHDACLELGHVRVFDGMPSRSNNMLLYIYDSPQPPQIAALAGRYLNKIVYVNWPHLMEAKVSAITDCTMIAEVDQLSRRPNVRNLTEHEMKPLCDDVSRLKRIARERRGLVYETVDLIFYVLPLIGHEKDDRGQLRRYWAQNPLVFPQQLVVSDIEVHNASIRNRKRFRTPAGIPVEQQLAEMRKELPSKPLGVTLPAGLPASKGQLAEVWQMLKVEGNTPSRPQPPAKLPFSFAQMVQNGGGPTSRGSQAVSGMPPDESIVNSKFSNMIIHAKQEPASGESHRDVVRQHHELIEKKMSNPQRPRRGSSNIMLQQILASTNNETVTLLTESESPQHQAGPPANYAATTRSVYNEILSIAQPKSLLPHPPPVPTAHMTSLDQIENGPCFQPARFTPLNNGTVLITRQDPVVPGVNALNTIFASANSAVSLISTPPFGTSPGLLPHPPYPQVPQESSFNVPCQGVTQLLGSAVSVQHQDVLLSSNNYQQGHRLDPNALLQSANGQTLSSNNHVPSPSSTKVRSAQRPKEKRRSRIALQF